MKLNIPYYSQRTDVKDPEWKNRACGAINIKMVLEFYDKEMPATEELIKEGLCIGGYNQDGFWRHDALVMLARNHGCHGYVEEFRSHTIDTAECTREESKHEAVLVRDGLEKMQKEIAAGHPVIVSVLPGFANNKTHHTVIATGVHEEDGALLGWYVHDPGAFTEEEGKHVYVPLARLMEHWKKIAIFIYPQGKNPAQ